MISCVLLLPPQHETSIRFLVLTQVPGGGRDDRCQGLVAQSRLTLWNRHVLSVWALAHAALLCRLSDSSRLSCIDFT